MGFRIDERYLVYQLPLSGGASHRRLQVSRVGAYPHQNGRQKPNDSSVRRKRSGVAGHSEPQGLTAHFIGNGDFCREDSRTAERIRPRQRSGDRNLPLSDALGNRRDPGVVDAAWDVVEDDIDGRAFSDRLKAIESAPR